MKKILLGVSFALAGGSALAGDKDFDDRWNVTPSASFIRADSDKNIRSGIAFGIGFGRFVSERVSIDLELDKMTADLSSGGEISQKSIGLMSRYHFTENMGFRSYFGLGFGALHHNDNVTVHSNSVPSGTEAMMNLAVGMNKNLTDRVKLRTELRYRLENSDDTVSGQNTFGEFMFNAGLSIAIGELSNQTTQTTLVQQAPIDSDRDGVSDAKDRCPQTPLGTNVDSTGCGIVDGDDDNDGVPNSRDACPNSVAGAVVGSDGCEVKVVIELQGVHFDTDKSTLKPESIAILDAAVRTLGEHGTILVEVAGHTDSTASDAHNQALSERRAKVVHAYLVDHGVSSDRMTWKGYGESQPIATNDTEDGKAKNRRTELIVK